MKYSDNTVECLEIAAAMKGIYTCAEDDTD
jgi:hypothetical protein